jgi:hypothetical protein
MKYFRTFVRLSRPSTARKRTRRCRSEAHNGKLVAVGAAESFFFQQRFVSSALLPDAVKARPTFTALSVPRGARSRCNGHQRTRRRSAPGPTHLRPALLHAETGRVSPTDRRSIGFRLAYGIGRTSGLGTGGSVAGMLSGVPSNWAWSVCHVPSVRIWSSTALTN